MLSMKSMGLHRNHRRLWLVLLLVMAGCSRPDLAVEDARVRQPVPGKDLTAAYFQFTNHRPQAVTIVSLSSDRAERVEMHDNLIREDRVRMVHLEQLEVAPGERVMFEPGGKHLMLFGYRPETGPVPVTFTFASGETLTTQFRQLTPPGGK